MGGATTGRSSLLTLGLLCLLSNSECHVTYMLDHMTCMWSILHVYIYKYMYVASKLQHYNVQLHVHIHVMWHACYSWLLCAVFYSGSTGIPLRSSTLRYMLDPQYTKVVRGSSCSYQCSGVSTPCRWVWPTLVVGIVEFLWLSSIPWCSVQIIY